MFAQLRATHRHPVALESKAELCSSATVRADGLVAGSLLLLPRCLFAEVLDAYSTFD